MSSTLLQLAQQAMQEMGVVGSAAPATVISNTNTDVVQMLALLNGLGNDLARQHQWQAITKEYRFTTVFKSYTGDTTKDSTSVTNMSSIVGLDATFMVTGTGIEQDTYVSSASGTTVVLSRAASATGTTVALTFSQTKYSTPSDYDRLVDRTDWDKSKHWEMLGPENAQQWQWLKSGFISTGPRVRFRVLGNYFQIWPALGAADYMGFEYVSNQWVTATGGSAPTKTSFTVDTDTCVFHDRLVVSGAKLRYFQSKGFDTTAVKSDYDMQLDLAKAMDAGSPKLSLAPQISDTLLTWNNIPDSGYGT